jgi:hypothetical protein
MTALPPSPFFDSGVHFALSPDEAAASRSQVPVAAAEFESAPPTTFAPTTAAATAPQPVAAASLPISETSQTERRIEEASASCPDAGATDCIGEIFAGARKLEGREISLSELCERGFDLHAFMDELDPPPLFLQAAQ